MIKRVPYLIRRKATISKQNAKTSFAVQRIFGKKKETGRDEIIDMRKKYLSPALTTFEAYDQPMVLTKGERQYLYDEENTKYIDFLGQNLCVSVGYGRREIISAACSQMSKLGHCTTMYYHEEPGLLAKEIVAKIPPHPSGEDWVIHFVNSGSEAVDLAIQMARVHTGRQETFALQKAYHGLQGYAAGLTAIGKSTQSCYSGMFSSIFHVESNNIEQLENTLTFGSGGAVSSMIIEPIQGFGGIHPLKNGYMKDAFELIKKHGGVTISDEVQTGYGRCGESFWGFEMENNQVIPDMITMAKGMGNGVAALGAVACRRSIAESFTEKMFFNTYGSNPVACAVGRQVLKIIDEENLIANCLYQGQYMNKLVSGLCDEYPEVFKEIRGTGLFQGLEIAGKTEEESQQNAFSMHRELLKHGVILGRGSAQGNVFRLQPPLCIEGKDMEHLTQSLRTVAEKHIEDARVDEVHNKINEMHDKVYLSF